MEYALYTYTEEGELLFHSCHDEEAELYEAIGNLQDQGCDTYYEELY
jgi:hypothetical protein